MRDFETDFISIGEDGRFRSSKMERLAEMFEDYDPELELQWIPPEYRVNDHAPTYRLVHHSSKHGSYVVGSFYEYDEPEQVFARFLFGDTRRNNVLGMLSAQDDSETAFRMKKWLDDEDERKSKTEFFLTGKNYITMRDHKGDLVKYDDRRRKKRL